MPALGSAILAGILAGIYLLTHYNIKKITGQPDILQLSLIPSVSLFIYTLPVDHSLAPIIGAFLGLLILGCIAFFISGIWKNITLHRINVPGKKKKLIISTALITIYAIGACYIFIHSYNMPERIMIMAEKSVKEKNWENVLTQTEKYINSGRTNQLISYFHNLALYHLSLIHI